MILNCPFCEKTIDCPDGAGVVRCPICRGEFKLPPVPAAERSDRDFFATLLLCIFLGTFGVHRFYAGKIGTGVLMLLTFAGCGIWQLFDLILIACCVFKDEKGVPIRP